MSSIIDSAECLALSTRQIYTGERNGDDVDGWSSWGSKQHKTDCCEWEGVFCNNQTGHVIKLHLPGDFPEFRLKGEIDASLAELQYLTYLNLSSNYFEDSSIPKFLASLRHLRYLDLHDCGLSGGNILTQLGLFSHLQYLDLSWNFVGGAILFQLRNLSQWRHLDLSVNILKGEIPCQLENLSQLRHLDLSWNLNLTGAIPHQLGNLVQPQHVDLSRNNLRGAIPYQLGNLSRLQYLDLSDNTLSGTMPHQLGNLTNLQNLLLRDTGTLKIDQENSARHEWLSSLTSLTRLELQNVTGLTYSHNWLQMIAKLPNLKELTITYHNLSDECILSLPSLKFNSSSSLSKLDFMGNNFKSSAVFHWILNISPNLVDLSLQSNQLEGPIPFEFASLMNSLENLDLGSNQLKGGFKFLGHICTLHSLSLWFNLLSEELSTILETFSSCARCSLQYLDLSYNNITGTLLPDCWSPFKSLWFSDLSNNKFSREFPISVGSLQVLQVLILQNNGFTGELFVTLRSSLSLALLDAGNNKFF
ncbi:receptor-like protein 12 [Neltuma alba]|uniref:receptor-like protein 12 n=1 Tax=Neltuma alba TaxID=207710 RepID=UPI0010A4C36F|nr:receptor-like protein 12 [Prosopis alba]